MWDDIKKKVTLFVALFLSLIFLSSPTLATYNETHKVTDTYGSINEGKFNSTIYGGDWGASSGYSEYDHLLNLYREGMSKYSEGDEYNSTTLEQDMFEYLIRRTITTYTEAENSSTSLSGILDGDFDPQGTGQQTTNILDALSRTLNLSREPSQTASIIDVVKETFSKTRANIQNVNAVETLTEFFNPTGVNVQNVNVIDTLSKTLSFKDTGTQTTNILDSITETFSKTWNFNQTTTITDTLLKTFNPTTVQDSITNVGSSVFSTLGYEDTGTQSVNVLNVISSTLGFKDTGTQITNTLQQVSGIFRPTAKGTQYVNIGSVVKETQSLFTSFIQKIDIFNILTSNTNPNINWVEVNVRKLGNDQDVYLDVNTTDQDGNLDRYSIQFNNKVKYLDTTNDVVRLNISDGLENSGNVTVTDYSGSKDKYGIHFKVTDNNFKQGTGHFDLNKQNVSKNDTLYNLHSSNQFRYNITQYGADTFTGTLSPNSNTTLYSVVQGDYLKETTKWHTSYDEVSTVYNQSVGRTLNITNTLDYLNWYNISVGNTTNPDGFGNCSYCDDHNISISTDFYSNTSEWYDYGDIISDEYRQDITNVVVGERDTFWWEYYYENDTKLNFTLENIVANISVNDSSFEWGSFVVVEGDWSKNLTQIDTQTCSIGNADYTTKTIDNNTWKACAKDTDGNLKMDYFQVQVPHFTDWSLLVGGFLGKAPKPVVLPHEGDYCNDTQEGDEFGDLICHNNQWRDEDEIEREENIIDEEFVRLIGQILLVVSAIIIVSYIFYYYRFGGRESES